MKHGTRCQEQNKWVVTAVVALLLVAVMVKSKLPFTLRHYMVVLASIHNKHINSSV